MSALPEFETEADLLEWFENADPSEFIMPFPESVVGKSGTTGRIVVRWPTVVSDA